MKTKTELQKQEHFSFDDLCRIVSILRGPDGCPWDQKQGHRDLRNNLVEEAYEVCEGIDRGNDAILSEELGDVLLQVVFHAGIASDENRFGMQEILDGICKKMIRRHPHIFPTEADAYPKSWEELKREEKGFLTKKESLEKISRSLPSPMRAQKIIRKTEALSSSEAEKKGTPNDLGERFYALCREAALAGWDAEELFNHYLDSVIEKCTIYE